MIIKLYSYFHAKWTLLIISIFSFSHMVEAQNLDINLVNSRQINLIEEVIHSAKISTYDPKLILGQTKKESADSGAAEAAVLNWLSAMQNGSYTKALAFWDAESQQKISTQNTATKKTPSNWESEWRTLYSQNKTISLLNRIEYGSYVLIDYSISKNNQLETSETVALQQVGGKWVLTLALSESVIMQGWKTPDKRIRRLPKFAYQKVF